MPIDEVFPNPTVKQVIFQIRFPNLFFLESKIGEYQVAVMKDFPESQLGVQRNIVVAHLGPDMKQSDLPDELQEVQVQKIWTFLSPAGVKLNLQANALDLSSAVHKTYNNRKEEHRFRDLIELAVSTFLRIAPVPILKRVGLRYIDECPVPAKDNATYRHFYATTFPLERFAIPDAATMVFQARVRKGAYKLSFVEAFSDENGQPKLILDFDGYAEDVNSEDYLVTTDALHDLVVSEYQASIKEPVYEYMRRPKE